uniref:Uncharacterized protein n=1 Tax=Ditylum brightwellii TaxID=49249 RepID=A0A7S2ETG8_9STRA|mmetsp:Transcript_5114/g.7823  ORF Transcript_5114/g.7823 Transcript_5114/m.7823 type:complete len:103 (+) Transcript_5114:635-943(+)
MVALLCFRLFMSAMFARKHVTGKQMELEDVLLIQKARTMSLISLQHQNTLCAWPVLAINGVANPVNGLIIHPLDHELINNPSVELKCKITHDATSITFDLTM